MKVASAKPISSPGRAEKFPPPLMRFLRSNVGSKSRGRSSRASPLFTRKKTTASAADAEATQEPSSPKVTCIGQVRVRRSAKKPRPERKRGISEDHCCCVGKPKFFNSMNERSGPRSIRPAWRRWALFICCPSDTIRTQSTKNGSNRSNRVEEIEDDEKEEEAGGIEVKRGREFASSSCTPPKNALLLTRCRSAPYRSSSLAGRFWGSPSKAEAEKTEQENSESRTALASETEPIGRDSPAESRRDQESEDIGFGEGLVETKETGVENCQEDRGGKTEKLGAFDVARPPLIVLKRCNSEPARNSEKFNPENSNFERRRRLAFTESSTPHVN
ncbi:hypothetical protein Ancab_031976 [Ancistrocladus abbreviatus]